MISSNSRILAIGAHFDDIEISCGGTLASLSSMGIDVRLVVVGDGNYTNCAGKPVRTHQDALREGTRAIERLGLTQDDLINLKLPETQLHFQSDLVTRIEGAIEKVRPHIILTHWQHDTHQDHRAVSWSTISASRFVPSIWMWEPIFPSGRENTMPFVPQLYVDITRYHDAKHAAIRAHVTECEKFASRGINWFRGIDARERLRGFECGADYAEAFYVYRHKLQL